MVVEGSGGIRWYLTKLGNFLHYTYYRGPTWDGPFASSCCYVFLGLDDQQICIPLWHDLASYLWYVSHVGPSSWPSWILWQPNRDRFQNRVWVFIRKSGYMYTIEKKIRCGKKNGAQSFPSGVDELVHSLHYLFKSCSWIFLLHRQDYERGNWRSSFLNPSNDVSVIISYLHRYEITFEHT